MPFWDSRAVVLICAAWVVIVATAVIVFRKRLAGYLQRLAEPQENVAAQRRDITIGIILVAVFAYVLAATLAALLLLPAGTPPWPLAGGLPLMALLALLYSVRFSNAGLSAVNWIRR
ncbi:hypothetical protein [Leifsonia sp. fls2-241-R2A-40a]|uniref:hypothetical protein n=1 Tax=Leifsonia sp. fls2-241-R2A-40a TaxID=3040290 RepID=UPI002550AFE8|nr:hypothetical protein [Leifsonia sp. fls2-241-R2A-40a]